MAADEIVWQVINQQFCSFKLKLDNRTQTFCRNEHNLTGFCNRQSCPLANSRYATVRPDAATGSLALYIKTPERAHLPSQWWEKVQLSSNYEKALATIDEKLLYWNKFTIHKCKQRLTRLTQVHIRERRIAKEEVRLGEKLVPKLASKIKRREDTRERKAESAAKVERAIERELIERLRSGAYGDRPLNVEEGVWKKVLKGLERAEKVKDGVELEDEEEEEEDEAEQEFEREADVEYVSDLEESDMGEMEDFDDWFDGQSADDDDEDDEQDDDEDDESSGESEEGENDQNAEDGYPEPGSKRKRPSTTQQPKARKRNAPRMEIEYETEPVERQRLLA